MKISMKKTTIYFDNDLYWALQLKAAETNQSLSELVNHLVKLILVEYSEDAAAFADRRHEPGLPFEDVLEDLRLRSKI
jgi:hypothetical protein